jgi:hypothetical protein
MADKRELIEAMKELLDENPHLKEKYLHRIKARMSMSELHRMSRALFNDVYPGVDIDKLGQVLFGQEVIEVNR